MQTEPITLAPSTPEHSAFSFLVEEPLVIRFIEFLGQKGLAPKRASTVVEETGQTGEPLVQVDVESTSPRAMLEELKSEFLGED